MDTVVRVAIVYVFILAGLRVLGKREFGQLGPAELVTLFLIPEMVSQSIIGEDFSMVNALVGVSTLFMLVFVVSALAHRSRRFEQLVQSSPAVLVQHGQFITASMDRERVSPDEIFSQVRMAGLERLSQVKWAVLEGDGRISIVPEESEGTLRPRQTRGAT